MKLQEIQVADVLAGKNWVIVNGAVGDPDPGVKEAHSFTPTDLGLLSAVVKFADDSEHPSLVIRSFPQGSEDMDVYIHTKLGWLNIHTPGFMRAAGKYSHEIFPFDYQLANPWIGSPPVLDKASPQRGQFHDAAARIKAALLKH